MAKKKKAKKAKTPKTYLVIYQAPASAMKKMKTASAEEKAAGMEAWMKWGKKCGKQLVDFGEHVACLLLDSLDCDVGNLTREVDDAPVHDDFGHATVLGAEAHDAAQPTRRANDWRAVMQRKHR